MNSRPNSCKCCTKYNRMVYCALCTRNPDRDERSERSWKDWYHCKEIKFPLDKLIDFLKEHHIEYIYEGHFYLGFYELGGIIDQW